MKYFCVSILLTFLSLPALACESPDETTMYYGYKEGFWILETVWGKHTYQLKILGDPESAANERRIDEWVAKHCAAESKGKS